MKVSEIGLGGWLTFGNALGRDAAGDIMDEAFDLGITYFDNADVYAAGECETVWGNLLESRQRSSYVLATKCLLSRWATPRRNAASARKHVMESVRGRPSAACGRATSTSTQCHRWDEETPLEETVAGDGRPRQGGQDRLLGLQPVVGRADQGLTLELVRQRRASTGPRQQPAAVQCDPEGASRTDVFPTCATRTASASVVLQPAGPGRADRQVQARRADCPAIPGPRTTARTSSSSTWSPTRTCCGRSSSSSCRSPRRSAARWPQLALAWCLRRKEVSSVIVGATKAKQLKPRTPRPAASTLDRRHHLANRPRTPCVRPEPEARRGEGAKGRKGRKEEMM